MKIVKIPILFLSIILLNSSCEEEPKNLIIRPVEKEEINMDSDCTALIINDSVKSISDILMGFNLVYPNERDAIWQDGRITMYLKNMKSSLLRYPGGTVVSFYHWNALSGHGHSDRWEPGYSLTNKPKSEFMDLDQYIALIKNTGATPLVGINMSSGHTWNRQQDGINEAIALMNNCKDKNFPVEYWYLDNEPYMDDSNGGEKTITEYANLINVYATAMKAINPDIQLIANWRADFKGRRSEYKTLFEIAGENIDIIDVHYYWAWSGPTMAQWLMDTPIKRWTKDTFIQDIANFRQMAGEFGYPDTKLAALEWNLGPISAMALDQHQCAIIQAEIMMQFMIGGIDMATFWPLHWPNKDITLRTVVDSETNNINPNYDLFRFMGEMQGSIILANQIEKSVDKTLFVAGYNNSQNILRIVFLNKNETSLDVRFNSELFENMLFMKGNIYSLTASGTGSSLIQIARPLQEGNAIKITAPAYSLSMLTLVKK
jgi:hypothetical protein